MHIRKATMDDFPAITLLEAEVQAVHVEGRPDRFIPNGVFSCDAYAELFADAQQAILLCIDADAVVGYLHYEILDKPASEFMTAQRALHVHALSVKAGQRRKGYGEALMDAVLQAARENAVPRITLDVWAFNQAAIGFYERLGYAPFKVMMERNVN